MKNYVLQVLCMLRENHPPFAIRSDDVLWLTCFIVLIFLLHIHSGKSRAGGYWYLVLVVELPVQVLPVVVRGSKQLRMKAAGKKKKEEEKSGVDDQRL